MSAATVVKALKGIFWSTSSGVKKHSGAWKHNELIMVGFCLLKQVAQNQLVASTGGQTGKT